MKQKLSVYREQFRGELFESCIPFWLEHGWDRENGGVLNCLDRFGQVYSTDKSVWMQGRTAWTYAHLCNEFGYDPQWAAFSKSCLDFLQAHCFDSDGRMYFTVTKDGKPLRKRRYWFGESFYAIACAEYYRLTQEESYLLEAKKYFDLIYGIYKNPESDPRYVTPKFCSETRRTKSLAEPMILLNVSSILQDVTGDESYQKIADGLVADIQCFYQPELHAMLESVTPDNEYISDSASGRIVNPGHDLECCWFLLDYAKAANNQKLAEFCETVFADALRIGWDQVYGGILYFKDIEGKPVEAYEHDMKLWWPHNEGAIAALKLYLHTGKEEYFRWFQKIADYAFAHFSDPEQGEWFGYLRRDGKPTEPPCKGHTYKGAFHVMRMLITCIRLLENI